MKKILMSMKPIWRDKIMSGEKIYEYRTRFTDVEVIAFLYVSQPVCAITGILHLGKKIYLEDWKKEYSYNSCVMNRILEYENRGNRVAMPVLSYQETNEISLYTLRRDLDKFIVPQSYYYIVEDSELERYLKVNLKSVSPEVENDIDGSEIDEICRNYREG